MNTASRESAIPSLEYRKFNNTARGSIRLPLSFTGSPPPVRRDEDVAIALP
jgi:hypothetical protein